MAGAYTGQSALIRLRADPPDLVLLDLLLSDTTGFELLAEMRADPKLAGIPVVAVTAATPGEDQLAAGGVEFTLKRNGPYRSGELLRLLECVFNQAMGSASPTRSAGMPVAPPDSPA